MAKLAPWITRLALVAVFAFLLELAYAAHTLALQQRAAVLLVAIAGVYPWLCFAGRAFLIDEPRWGGRAWLTLADSVGACVGTLIVLIFFYMD